MSSQSSAVRTFDRAERRKSSVNGNPRWRVFFADGSSAETQTDASVGYEVDNFRAGDRVSVKFSRAGRIVDMSREG